MADSPDLYPPPSPPHQRRPNLPMLYYGLIVVGTTAIVLALYNLIIIKWCSTRRRFIQSNTTASSSDITNTGHSFENPNRYLLSSFKYRRENRDRTGCKEQGGEDEESECVVCLASFEEGEEIRQLPRCKHSFHIQCIDMWLYSHSDCPVCRAPVTVLPRFHHRRNNDTAVVDVRYDSSRESLAMGPTFAV